MLPYWLLFGYFATGALLAGRRRTPEKSSNRLARIFGAVVVALMIGFRYRVGADWEPYEFMFEYSKYASFERMLGLGDAGYMFLNSAVSSIGLEIWAVNLASGILFTWGLWRFTKTQPDPWLAMVVAVPYLIVVVAMGYSRQGVAIGILLAGLASIDRNFSILRFGLYVAVAALFHRTAVFAFPLVMFASYRNKLVNIFFAAVTSWLLFTYFLKDSIGSLVENYVDTQYSSQGAAVRVLMNTIPALLFLIFQNRFGFSGHQKLIWRYFSIAAIALLILLIITPSSTAIDRLALYVIPLQIVVLSRLHSCFGGSGLVRIAVISYSAVILFVWLNFAVYADYWVPYRLYPLWD